MAEIADSVQSAGVRRNFGLTHLKVRAAAPALPPLRTVNAERWHDLSVRALEPNGYYLPEWEMAVNAFSEGRTDVLSLTAERDGGSAHTAPRLTGLLPVIPAARAYALPLPVLVSADAYGTLGTPLLDRMHPCEAADGLFRKARRAGAHALVLRNVVLDGSTMATFTHVLGEGRMKPTILQRFPRACLDATRDAEELLREALGAKKLKELRRQRNRLAEHGEVTFSATTDPSAVANELDTFLALEASGWKGERGTALIQKPGDTAFIRQAVAEITAGGKGEIVTLRAGDTPVASAIVLRHLDRAFYFKIGIDERFAKYSPGVQLTLDLTRRMCADTTISTVDSTAAPNHPMIDPIWRGRLNLGDVILPLYRRDPVIPLLQSALVSRRFAFDTAHRILRKLSTRR